MRGFSGCINHRQVVECFAWPSIEKLHKRYMATLVVNATTHLKKKKTRVQFLLIGLSKKIEWYSYVLDLLFMFHLHFVWGEKKFL